MWKKRGSRKATEKPGERAGKPENQERPETGRASVNVGQVGNGKPAVLGSKLAFHRVVVAGWRSNIVGRGVCGSLPLGP